MSKGGWAHASLPHTHEWALRLCLLRGQPSLAWPPYLHPLGGLLHGGQKLPALIAGVDGRRGVHKEEEQGLQAGVQSLQRVGAGARAVGMTPPA